MKGARSLAGIHRCCTCPLTFWRPRAEHQCAGFCKLTTAPLTSRESDERSQFNLGWKLALAYKGIASPILLSTYQTERMPVVIHMLIATSNLYTHLVPKKADSDTNADANKTGFLQWRNRSLLQYDIN